MMLRLGLDHKTKVFTCSEFSRYVLLDFQLCFSGTRYHRRFAYNDGFRQLLNEYRWCSVSKLCFNHIPAVIRKLIYSLWCTVFNSDNVLLHGLANSDLYVQIVQSPLFRRCRMILY